MVYVQKKVHVKLLLWSIGTGLQCWVSLVKCSKMTSAEFPLQWNETSELLDKLSPVLRQRIQLHCLFALL